MASRNKSWGPRQSVRTRIIVLVLTFFIVGIVSLDVIANVEAETPAGPFKDGCPRYPVCLMNGVILKTKYGSLTAQRNMLFNRIDVNANGSIIFDLSTWVPRAEEILLFNAASFGNGTFSIQLLGYPITAVSFGAAYTVQYATQLTGGLGGIVNLIAGSNMTSALQLVINYTPFGGACTPLCVNGSNLFGSIIFFGIAGFLLLLIVISRTKKSKVEKVETVTIGQ